MKKRTEKTLFIIALIVWFFLCIMLFWGSIGRENRAMATHYCFEEQADGSLYHYVCEK